MPNLPETNWRQHGVRIVRHDQLDPNTAQTPGMTRAAAINQALAGAQRLWAGTVAILPDARTGAHHHGELESIIYVVSGRARLRWGERLEFAAEAGPGDFIYIPPSCRTRRSTPCPTRRSSAWWSAATRSRWWSISTSNRSNRRKRCAGTMAGTRARDW